MAKQFKIYFSESDERVDIKFDKSAGVENVSPRRLEIEMLLMMYKFAARSQTAIADSRMCADCVDQLENLTDADKYIQFTEADLKFARKGFEKTVGVRDYTWNEYGDSLLRQIEKPFDPEKTVVFDHDLKRFKEE